MNYVAGFLFSQDRQRVALVLKQRPSRQKGLLNAIGGKVEAGESPLDAMKREFREETGVEDVIEWTHDTILMGQDFRVDFYSATGRVDEVRTATDEPIRIVDVADVLLARIPAMRNLPLLLSVALDGSGVVRPVLLNDGVPQP